MKHYMRTMGFGATAEQMEFFRTYPRIVASEFIRDALDRAIEEFKKNMPQSLTQYISESERRK